MLRLTGSREVSFAKTDRLTEFRFFRRRGVMNSAPRPCGIAVSTGSNLHVCIDEERPCQNDVPSAQAMRKDG